MYVYIYMYACVHVSEVHVCEFMYACMCIYVGMSCETRKKTMRSENEVLRKAGR